MIKKVIRDWLAADSAITSKLATYEFTTGVPAPAIFTSRVIPERASYPAIHIALVGGVGFGYRGDKGGDLLVDVNLYDDKDQSSKELDDLAVLLWQRLDRAAIDDLLAAEGAGWRNWGCRADPPMYRGDEDGFPGYLVRVSARIST